MALAVATTWQGQQQAHGACSGHSHAGASVAAGNGSTCSEASPLIVTSRRAVGRHVWHADRRVPAAAGCPSHAHAGRRRPGHPAQRAADAAAHSAHPGAAWAMDRHRPERGQARCRRGAAHVPGGEPRGSAVAAAAGGRRWRLAHSAAVCCARERLVTRAVIGFVVPTGRRKDAHGVRGPRRGTVPRYARRACDDRPQRGPPGAVPRPAADHCHKRSILRPVLHVLYPAKGTAI
mmetsp:Transcript_26586/g.78977  ORF Transcript_26586/g.78977 Transcript_26586/m.78977 type:complete len:234 (+) Transcript_26586:533-1234(+)